MLRIREIQQKRLFESLLVDNTGRSHLKDNERRDPDESSRYSESKTQNSLALRVVIRSENRLAVTLANDKRVNVLVRRLGCEL